MPTVNMHIWFHSGRLLTGLLALAALLACQPPVVPNQAGCKRATDSRHFCTRFETVLNQLRKSAA